MLVSGGRSVFNLLLLPYYFAISLPLCWRLEAGPSLIIFKVQLSLPYFHFSLREPFWDLTELRTLRNTLRKDPEFHHSDWRQVSEDAKDFIRSKNNILCPMMTFSLKVVLRRSQLADYPDNVALTILGSRLTCNFFNLL